MPVASRPRFLRHFGRGTASCRGPDLADMGTAFALDEALDCGVWNSPAPGEPPRPARVLKRVAPWRRWLGRKLGA